MKKGYKLFVVMIMFFAVEACNKETAKTQVEVMTSLLANKNWFLDYTVTDNITKSYIGQATYFASYYKDGTIKDSDGLSGTYTIAISENKSKLYVNVKTNNGNFFEVVYDIISIGESKLVLSKPVKGQSSPIQLYFNSK